MRHRQLSRGTLALLTAITLFSVLALAACEREARHFDSPPTAGSPPPHSSPTGMHAGPPASSALAASPTLRMPPAPSTPIEENAYAVSQGKRLYRWYNCNGCHAGGGGGIGPALMDERWRYGHEPAQIVATILQGRPNGMPSFAGRIPDEQAWQIAAYVRSMSGLLRSDVAPSRSDALSAGEPEQRREPEQPKAGQ
jgi:cytochrome c oxidase cbb3-type subunit 3